MTFATLAQPLVEWLALLGALFVLLGSLGIVKLSGYLLRLHAATKASTLGVGAILLASALHFSVRDGAASLIEVLAAVLLFATVPVSAQMLARAALHLHPGMAPPPPVGAPPGAVPGTATTAHPADGNSPPEARL